MDLSAFLKLLFNEGKIIVPRELNDFDKADIAEAKELLQQEYDRDITELPGQAPAFDENAACWAANYLFRASQFTLLRNLESGLMDKWLPVYHDTGSASAIYSVDLLFRHLGDLVKLIKNLAPDDPLVNHIHQVAAQWPFSSVGTKVNPSVPLTAICSHPALRYIYADRIIKTRDETRAKETDDLLAEVMGMHKDIFWPTP
ncbi:MAG: hypothetical protein AAGC65_05610 [Mucilaginibacter sp.]|uniref:hypothetical protein n=1 Tax=Mucilaginibacter sp. TaxID=1882438 RepID=UPI0031AB2EDC